MIYNCDPNYEKAKNLAYETLIEYSCTQLPVNVKAIIKQYENIKMFTFEKFMNIMNLAYDEIIDKFASEHGFTIYDTEKDKYIIVYNEKDNEEAQRWTLAHELGHIENGHLKSDDYNLIHYNNGEHPMEKEANAYAKHLLAPFPLLSIIHKKNKNMGDIRPDDVSIIFGINFTPSANICEHFNKLRYYPRHQRLEEKFYQCIENIKIGPSRYFTPISDDELDILLGI